MNVVRIKLLDENARIPTYAEEGASGFDFYAVENQVIPVGGSGIVRTGLAVEIPLGFEIQARGRSGLAFRDDVIAHFGTIDASYRGEIKVKLFNLGNDPLLINTGDRIAQGVLAPVEKAVFMQVSTLTVTGRGGDGFGSTGK